MTTARSAAADSGHWVVAQAGDGAERVADMMPGGHLSDHTDSVPSAPIE
jgi:hypothetical protein